MSIFTSPAVLILYLQDIDKSCPVYYVGEHNSPMEVVTKPNALAEFVFGSKVFTDHNKALQEIGIKYNINPKNILYCTDFTNMTYGELTEHLYRKKI